MQLTKLIFPKTHLFVFLNAHLFVLWIMKGDVSYARLPFFVCRRNGSQKRIFAPTNQLRGSDGP